MKVSDILRIKGDTVHTVLSWNTIAEAATRLAGPPAIGALVVALLVLLLGFLLFGNGDSDTQAPPTTETSAPPTTETTTEAPTSGNDGGIQLPSNIPGLPSGLPSLPSNLPSLPSELPSLPSNLPDPGQIGQDAQGFWESIQQWWSGITGN